MSYSRRVLILKSIGVFNKNRKRSSTSTTTVYENNLPQNLLARKHRRKTIIVRPSKPTNIDRLSAIVFFIFLIILLLKIINSSELEIPLAANEEHRGRLADVRRRAQLYLADVYKVAKAPLTSFYENLVASLARMRADREAQLDRSLLNKKPRRISFNTDQNNADYDKPVEVRLNSDGAVLAKVINRAVMNNRFNSTKLYRSLANRVTVEPTRHLLKHVSDNQIACVTTSPSGSDARIYCTTKFLCSLSGGRPKGPCIAGKVNYINPVKTFGEIHWKQSANVSAQSTCILAVKTKSKLQQLLSKPICKIRLEFMSLSISQPTSGICTEAFPISQSSTVVPIRCDGKSRFNKHLDVLSSAVTANDVQLMFNFVAGTGAISWNIVVLPCRAFFLVGNATRRINDQTYTVCFRTELISEKRAEKMNLAVYLVNSNGGDAFSFVKASTNVVSALAVIQANLAAVATAAFTQSAPGV
ncbi:hypothetical protein DAPPUDRAFT_325676 [Daphnia pulex]|uniref:Uncharacterized protein n=1 Tax=Daphnia pulex TaxID=6669 RepID=E9H5Q4_DAPPU|nr:hypothetical protein DAPPUDRAFT_325676 [Daphnia pulex]|eukprot:EFX73047.1 hypothetical protein DAPPUDRAFT_325676 [Daphnia pulex]